MRRSGCGTSLRPANCPRGKSMNAPLRKSAQTTLQASTSATSSPGSEGGLSPSGSQAGPTTDLFGQEVAPASHSAAPARARQAMTSATCGLRGFLSSPSAALQSSLENRLKRRLDGAGSTLFSLTWKAKATPAGRPYSQLAASAPRTSGNDFGSWPTPCVVEPNTHPDKVWQRKQRLTAATGVYRGNDCGLGSKAQLAAWPTPMAGTPAQKGYNEAGSTDSGRKTVALANWATPRAEDSESSGMRWGRGVADTLTAQASLSTWATPAHRDYRHANAKPYSERGGGSKGEQLNNQAVHLLDSGPTPNGSPAQTEKPGQLAPDHSRWLMGYSAEHLSCAPMETPSFLKSRRSS